MVPNNGLQTADVSAAEGEVISPSSSPPETCFTIRRRSCRIEPVKSRVLGDVLSARVWVTISPNIISWELVSGPTTRPHGFFVAGEGVISTSFGLTHSGYRLRRLRSRSRPSPS